MHDHFLPFFYNFDETVVLRMRRKVDPKGAKKLIQHESSIKSSQFHSDAGGFSPSEACMRSGQTTATRTLSAAACESELSRLTALIYKPQHYPAVSFRVFPRETLAGFKISPPAS